MNIVVAFIPIIVVAAFAIGLMWYFYKLNAMKMEMIRLYIEKGGSLDEHALSLLNPGGYKRDYRTGLVWLAAGIPLTIGIWLDENMSSAVFGLVPVFVGMAYLIAGKLRLREPE
ncbi:MAG: DUF6249 domain-containing protein [Pseudomonadales bacterium]